MLLGLASTWGLLHLQERPKSARWLLYAAASTLALYCFYYTGFLFLCHGLYLVGGWWGERSQTFTEQKGPTARESLWAWARAMALTAALFLPGALVLLGQLSGGTWGWIGAKYGRPGIGDLLETGIAFSAGPTWHGSGAARWAILAAFGIVMLAAIARLSWDRRRVELRFAPARGAWFWLLCLMVPVGAIFVASQLVPGFLPRYLATFVPAYCALLGIGLDRLRPPPVKALAALALIAVSVSSLWVLYGQVQKEDWRGLVERIVAQQRPGDEVLLVDQDASAVFTYYAGDATPFTGVSGTVSEPSVIKDIVDSLPQGTERIWLITSHTTNRALEEYLRTLDTYARQGEWDFQGADLALFRRVR
jgi:uncharacterized membrane protein